MQSFNNPDKSNLSREEKAILWEIIHEWERKNGISKHKDNWPRYSVKGTTDGGYNFWCSGCNEVHHIPNVGNNIGSLASFNGDLFEPTFLNPRTGRTIHLVTHSSKGVCLYTIESGIINYMSSCPHILSGMAVELREYKDWEYITIRYTGND